jgi:hypothetical protein
MSIMDQVKKNLREWYALAADRTGEMAKISVRMYDKYGISREIERQLSELGSHVYHAVEQGRTDFTGDTDLERLIERIGSLERDLEAKVEEIETIRQTRQQRQDTAGAAAAEAAAGDEIAAAFGASEPVAEGAAQAPAGHVTPGSEDADDRDVRPTAGEEIGAEEPIGSPVPDAAGEGEPPVEAGERPEPESEAEADEDRPRG